jgi:hypothetical protein
MASKTYLPTAAVKMGELCDYVTKHAAVMASVVAAIDPAHAVAFAAAVANIQAACVLFNEIQRVHDPYWHDTTARTEP